MKNINRALEPNTPLIPDNPYKDLHYEGFKEQIHQHNADIEVMGVDFHEANKPIKPVKLDPKVTAKELTVAMYKHIFDIDSGSTIEYDGKRLAAANQCAQVCVEQIIKSIKFADYKVWNNDAMNLDFWQDVKEFLKKDSNR